MEADENQVWGGMVWHANPLQRFAKTQGIFTEELQREAAIRKMEDLLFLSLPEVEEAGSFNDALAEIEKAV